MMAMSASAARAGLFGLLQQVNDNEEVIEIVSNRGTAFLVPEDQWHSMEETLHLLSTPANALRLMQAIQDVRNGVNVQERELIDPDRQEHKAS